MCEPLVTRNVSERLRTRTDSAETVVAAKPLAQLAANGRDGHVGSTRAMPVGNANRQCGLRRWMSSASGRAVVARAISLAAASAVQSWHIAGAKYSRGSPPHPCDVSRICLGGDAPETASEDLLMRGAPPSGSVMWGRHGPAHAPRPSDKRRDRISRRPERRATTALCHWTRTG